MNSTTRNSSPVADAGRALQDSFDNFFPWEKLLNERDRSILSSARSDMVRGLLSSDLESIEHRFGADVRRDRDGKISVAIRSGDFAKAGSVLQEVLDTHRNRNGDGKVEVSELDALESRLAADFRHMASLIEKGEGVIGELQYRLYRPRVRWLARLGF